MRTSIWLGLVLLAACNGKDDDDKDTDVGSDDTDVDTDGTDTDTDAAGVCGDGVLDEGESCDLAELNAEDGNCRLDCTCAPQQVWSLSFAEATEIEAVDGRGVVEATAPAGTGAWGTSTTDLGADGTVKFELYAPTTAPGFACFAGVTVGDIDTISYHTWKELPESSGDDFFAVIYTEPDGVDDSGTFYGSRLTALTYQSRDLDAPASTWNQWTSAAGTNQLTWADEPRTGTFYGTDLPSLGELTDSSAFDWSTVIDGADATALDYGSEPIKFLSVQTGSGTQTSAFTGLLDALEITFKDGRSVTVDLEP